MEKLDFTNMDESKLSEMIDPWINENIDDLVGESRQLFYRCPKTLVDYDSTTWGRWLKSPQIRDPKSKIAKMFMLRFRVPFILFEQKIVPMCRENDVFDIT
jgi:hypothetical protein